MVPAAPGFLGTYDAAVIFALKAFGVTGGQAIGVDLMVRFVVFVPITAVGLILVITRYGGLKVLRRRREAAEASKEQPALAAREAA
jgi:hypothetical protein